MAKFSGKDGTATSDGNPIVNLDGWEFETDVTVHSYHDNECTGGWEEQVTGTRRWSGSYRTGNKPEDAGDTVSLVLYDDVNIHTGEAVITNVRQSCDINGDVVGWVSTFKGDGGVVSTTGSAV